MWVQNLEKLAGDFQSWVSMIFERPLPDRNLYLCEASSIDQLPDELSLASQRFCLLLAMDADAVSSDLVFDTALTLVRRGLVYLCAWGPGCKRVHDIFDDAALGTDLVLRLTGDDVIMTTSHEGEPLTETLWYFVHSAFPTPGLEQGCSDWIVACVGKHEWARKIRDIARDTVYLPPQD